MRRVLELPPDRWEAGRLSYFDGRQTNGPVEGVNNKAWVVVRRAYGQKPADRRWTRLVLGLNRGRDVIRHTIEPM